MERQQAGQRGRGARGATLVEYALGVAVLVVASLVALGFLSAQAGKEARAQSDCISTRPPPTSCVASPVPAPATSSPSSTAPPTTTGGPAPTDPEPTTTTTAPPPESSASGGAATTQLLADGSWSVMAPVSVTDDDGGGPIADARITARLVIGRQPLLVECTTDASGSCSLVVASIPADVGAARLAVLSVVSDPRVTGTLPSWDLTKP